MNFTINKNYLIFIIFLILFSRYILINFFNNIPTETQNLWQLLSYDSLKNNLLESIFLNHSQPPLYNFIIGLIAKFSENINEINLNIYYYNITLTCFLIYYLDKILIKLNLNHKTKLIALFFVAFYPSIIYFENYPLYTHTSCFLLFQLSYFLINYFENYSKKYLIYIYLNCIALTQIWGAFHSILFLVIIYILTFNRSLLKTHLTILILSILITNLPSIKNKIIFNFFGNSSWSGINLGESFSTEQVCRFYKNDKDLKFYNMKFKQRNSNNKYSFYYDNEILNSTRGTSKYNNVAYIETSKLCKSIFFEKIKDNFIDYSLKRLKVLIASHTKFSFDYYNWHQPGISSYLKKLDILSKSDFIKKISLFLFFTLFYFFILLNIIYFEKIKYKKFFTTLFIINIYFIFVTTAFGSIEQNRMRYTFLITFILFLFYIIPNIFKIIKARVKI